MLQKDLFGEEFDVDVTKKRKNWTPFKAALFAEYGDVCYLCKEVIDERDCEIDHVIPIAHRGKDEWENLRPTHWYCNKAKRAMMPDDPNLQAVIDMIPVKIKEAVRQKNCVKCNADISHKGRRAYVCDECVQEHRKALMRDVLKKKYDTDPEFRAKSIANATAWQKANRERVSKRQAKRLRNKYATDPEYRAKMIEKAKARHRANPERQKAYQKAWREANPDYHKEYDRKRRKK